MEGLTERERDVLRLLALQLSNEEIAETLGISRRTAETHVAHVVAKLGVASRREAGSWIAGRAKRSVVATDAEAWCRPQEWRPTHCGR